jgi:hypothetical protein
MSGIADIEFEPARVTIEAQPADLKCFVMYGFARMKCANIHLWGTMELSHEPPDY